MICNNCKKEILAGQKFCAYCGASNENYTNQQTVMQPVKERPVTVQTSVNNKVQAEFETKSDKIKFVMKNLAKSPLMIIGSAGYTLTGLCAIVIGLIMFFTLLFSMLTELEFLVGDGLLLFSELSSCITYLVSVVSSALIIFGLWHTVWQGFSKSHVFKTTGLSMIKTSVVANFVMFCITLLFSFLTTSRSEFAMLRTEEIVIVMVTATLTALPMMILMICQIVATVGSIDRGAAQAEYGTVTKPSSLFLAIMLFLSIAVTVIATVFIAVFGAIIFAAFSDVLGDEIATLLGGTFGLVLPVLIFVLAIPGFVSNTCFGLLIIKHRKVINKVNAEYFPPAE